MTDTINTVKVKGTKRATLALLLAFGALGASGYMYYQGMKAHAHTVYQLAALDNANIANSTQLQQNLVAINSQLDALKTKVDSFKTDKFSANNYQINTLISLAIQSLVAYHDVNSAIKLLGYVQSVIDVNNSAIYTELKVAITTDLDRLKQMPVVDRVVIATKLNNIIVGTDKLELIVNNEPTSSVEISDTANSKWNRFLEDIKTRLTGLVQISSANSNSALNLLPQNRAIIHQNLKLDILNARMALLQNDEANWQYSLNAAKQSLTTYFTSSAGMNSVMDEIGKLQQLDISYGDVGIPETLKALNKLNNLEK
ncbi:MAG TPA: uroporphyrinogen-III C-methyltransferase [Aquella sp.]|nr:uroporphyrinogen-III C-methyltransferase [Aquella sp.]